MIKEQMTAAERVQAAIGFQDVDRTPFTVGLSGAFVATAAGRRLGNAYRMPQEELMGLEMAVWEELGGWDGRYSNVGLHHVSHGYPFTSTFWAIPRVVPGHDLPDDVDVQNVEAEIMKEDEYDRLLEVGWDEFWKELIARTFGTVDQSQLDRNSAAFISTFEHNAKAWTERGLPDLVLSASVMDPPVLLATWRSATPFMLDLEYQYDKVKRALLEVLNPIFLDVYRRQVEVVTSRSSAPMVMVPAARYITPFVSPKVFDELVWPWIKGCADIVLEMGRHPMFHLDSNWDENLECFLRLPKGQCVIHFGGETNIVKAKEVLKGHTCLMGDSPNSLMSLSSSDEVGTYFRQLVDAIGKDNGYIMTEGCYLAGTARLENVRAMAEVARSYKPR
jgi:hypothetical protein